MDATTEPSNGVLAPTEDQLELSIPCPDHPEELLQRLWIGSSSEKEALCVECLINLEDPKTLGANLVSPSQFINIANDFYKNAVNDAAEPTQIPSEYQNLLLKQAENIEKVSNHINKEKRKVEDKFKNLIQEFTSLCNKKMEEYLNHLDRQLNNFRYNYVYFEKQLHKAYPTEGQDPSILYPTKEALVEKFHKVTNSTQLVTLVKNIKQDLKEASFNPSVPQESVEENRKKNLETLVKTMQNSLAQLPTIGTTKNTSESDVLKTLKDSLEKALSKLLELDKEIFDLSKGSSAPNSKILTNPDQMTLLKKWVGKEGIGLKLLYRASKDGFTGSDFHSKCDGKAETITLVKTSTKVFGGYLDKAWETKEAWINSSKCFVFSITSKEKYAIKSGHEMYAAYGGSSYGPSFGGGYDFQITGTSGAGMIYSFDIIDLNNFTGGSSFTCEEIEVFQITSGPSTFDGEAPKKIVGDVITKEIKTKVADYMGNNISKFKLLYKGSEHGMTPENFHEKCDNKGPTLTFVKVKDSDDVIGGYTTQAWCAKENYAYDNEAFLFSIQKDLFCPVAIPDCAVFQSGSTGPYFGDDESLIVFREKQGGKYNVVVNAIDCYQDGTVLSNNGWTFEPEEVEVYEVSY